MTRATRAFQALRLGAIRPTGWLREQLRRDLEEGFAGRLDQLTEHARHDLFRQRILSSDSYHAWWDAETRGNWLWGYVLMAHLAESPSHSARAAELVQDLLATADDDGYIGIYGPSGRFRHAAGENGELWAQSRALLALIAFHEARGSPEARAAVRRAVDLTLSHYPEGRAYFRRGRRVGRDVLTGLTHGLCWLDVLEWLHEDTGDPAYAAAGVRFYRDFSGMRRPFPNDDLALPKLADAAALFGGHAVHTAEHLRALLWAHALAPEEVRPEIVARALERLSIYRLPSGALLGDENIHGLPLPEAAYELCTSTELAWSLAGAVQKLGHAYLADWLETLVFNAAQGARFPDGRAVAYLSADTRLAATADRPDGHSPGAPGRRFKYSPTHEDVACCCNPNALRVLPQFISRMWLGLRDEAGVAAVAYGPCILRVDVAGTPVEIVEQTDYPFADAVELVLNPARPVEFTLLLRRPSWPGSVDVSVPGADPVLADGWYRVRRLWAPGDRVRLSFDWRVRAESYGNGEVAVLRGPLQFALPLAHRLVATKDYPLPGFHDYDVLARDVAEGYRIPVLDERMADLGLTLETVPGGAGDRPWDAPRWRLRAGEAALVPLGCTILRRAAFPIRRPDARASARMT